MNTATVTTVSDRPAADAWARATTPASRRLQALGRRALVLLCVVVWCLSLAAGAEDGDDTMCAGQNRRAEDSGVRTFVIAGAASAAHNADEAIALAVLRQSRKPDEALAVGGMTDRAERKLRYAFPLALERVREVDTCRDLFTRLGADGVELLSTTVYRPAASERELEICSTTGALAFTTIGRSNTSLCDRFGGHSRQAAAMILIHEALHYAGMSEKPHDPDGMSSFQINRLVRKSCDL